MENALQVTIDDERVKHLCNRDERLKYLIHLVGEIRISLPKDQFQSLVSSIISQQLSVKAAATIQNRVFALCRDVTPSEILALPTDDLRNAGVSRSKITYMRDLSEKVLSKDLDLEHLHLLDDQTVIEVLTKVKGIGKWTAEMFLIFSLGRENILSLGDAGLQRAAKWLYNTDNALEEQSEWWNPYKSIASLYLWEAVDRGLVREISSNAKPQ